MLLFTRAWRKIFWATLLGVLLALAAQSAVRAGAEYSAARADAEYSAARADAESATLDRATYLLRAFDEAALWNETGAPRTPHKWTRPILRIGFSKELDIETRRMIETPLRVMAVLAGLKLERSSAQEADFLFAIEDSEGYAVNGHTAGCYTELSWGPDGALSRAVLHINLRFGQLGTGNTLAQCVSHETMHGFGFGGHPHTTDSTLSYAYRREAPTGNDRALFGLLYNPAILPNMFQMPALLKARDLIAQELGETNPEAGMAYLRQAVANLAKRAEAGDPPWLAAQIGVAYATGQFVPKDMNKALAFWKIAVAGNDPEGQFRLGTVLWTGTDTPQDRAQAVSLFQKAAMRGHSLAQHNLAIAYRAGIGGLKADKAEAYFWFYLAAKRGYTSAAQSRDKLEAELAPDVLRNLKMRANAWQPIKEKP